MSTMTTELQVLIDPTERILSFAHELLRSIIKEEEEGSLCNKGLY